MANDFDLGKSTSYAYYVSEGGTKTPQEFGEMLVNIDTVASRAEESASDAEESATSANESKESAVGSMNVAIAKANEASASADIAVNKAGEASASATVATNKATEASASATTATAKATESSQNALTAVGAKNDAVSAKNDAVTAKTQAQSAKDDAVSAKLGAESARDEVQSSAEQITQNTTAIEELKSDLTQKADTVDMLKAFPTDTASGSVASFADGANVPVKSLVVNIDPVQSGSGDPSPTNVRPISGWSEVNVSHSGADMTNPTVISIALGQTVYGGKLDVTKGELVIDRAMVDLGTLTWTYMSSSSVFRCSASPAKNPNIICSQYATNNPYVSWGQMEDGTIEAGATDLIVKDTRYTDAATFKSAMSGVQLVYELATPITVTLTPNELSTLLGANNIWSDAGEVTAEYRADPTLYIQRLTEPDADMIADANIVSGQYFMVGNTLYKATANIASGGAITPNVNCVRKSLSEALNELNV